VKVLVIYARVIGADAGGGAQCSARSGRVAIPGETSDGEVFHPDGRLKGLGQPDRKAAQ